jgi:predicted MFS family arabinose efflux permease
MGVAAKLIVDTTVQLYNPFLTIIAAGLGTSAIVMGRIVAIRSMMGFIAPIFGSLADRVGYRFIIRLSLFICGTGMILAALTSHVWIFVLAMVLSGIGQAGYTPTLHAYLSSRLPWEKRAWGLGILEYSWALAGIVGLLFAGYLIEFFNWRAPFYFLGGMLLFFALIYGTLPGKTFKLHALRATDSYREEIGVLLRLRKFFTLPGGSGAGPLSAWGTVVINGLNFFAMSHILIIHGGWLEQEYGLGAANLGKIALILGFFDLTASIIVSLAVDKIGKKRSVGIGITGAAIGYALLPFLNRSLPLAVLSIAIPRCFFEFAVVSNFPLMSEQIPEQRGKVLSLSMTVGLIGSTLAGITGPWAYYRFGVTGLGLGSLILVLISLAILLFVVKEPKHER